MSIITCIPYMYRDASNYKQGAEIYLAGPLSDEQVAAIAEKLYDGEDFIPFDLKLGIEELQSRMTSFPSEDDHPLHTLDLLNRTILEAVPEGAALLKVDEFVSAFSAITNSNGWQFAAADERLGLSDFQN